MSILLFDLCQNSNELLFFFPSFYPFFLYFVFCISLFAAFPSAHFNTSRHTLIYSHTLTYTHSHSHSVMCELILLLLGKKDVLEKILIINQGFVNKCQRCEISISHQNSSSTATIANCQLTIFAVLSLSLSAATQPQLKR